MAGKNRKKERDKLAPGFKKSPRVGGEITNDRNATEKEIKKGDYTNVTNLSND